jgi:hypothetical protein
MDIYKYYKHGGSLKDLRISINTIYNVLRRHRLQVVIVKDIDNKKMLYVYIPELKRFNRLV